MCAGACTSVEIRLSVKSSNQSGMSANGSFASLSLLRDSCTSLLEASSSLPSNTVSEDELAAALFLQTGGDSGPKDSCGGVVEDELLPELTDNPGTTRGRDNTVCLADKQLSILGQSWLLTADPLIGVSVDFAKLA